MTENSIELPAEIRTERSFPSGVRLILPRHNASAVRTAVFFITGLPLMLIMAGASVMCFLSALGVVDVGEANVSVLWFLPFGFFFAVPAFGLPLWELYVFFGRDEIGVSSSGLKAVWRLGPLRWTKRCSLRSVKRLNVPPSRSAFGWNPSGDTLVAEMSDEDFLILLRYYPNDVLIAVAEWLAAEVDDRRLQVAHDPIEAVSESREDRLQKPLHEQPAESRIRVEPLGEKLVLDVPPPGLLKHGGGVGAFTGVACVGMLLVAGIAALNLDLEIMIGFFIFAGLMALLCLGIFLWALNGASRRTILTVAPDRLKVEQTAAFGDRSYEWRPKEIARFKIGPSRFGTSPHRNQEGKWQPASSLQSPQGPRINREQQQVAELQIFPCDGEPVGLFAGRDEKELRWLATLLQDRLLSRQAGA